jgi:hypothetical protein
LATRGQLGPQQGVTGSGQRYYGQGAACGLSNGSTGGADRSERGGRVEGGHVGYHQSVFARNRSG